MNTYCDSRSSRPAKLFSFSLLDSLPGCLCRLHLREAPAGVGLSRLVTAFMNNPGQPMSQSMTNISLGTAFSAGLLSFVSPCVLPRNGIPVQRTWHDTVLVETNETSDVAFVADN